jgi:hypothetical protein
MVSRTEGPLQVEVIAHILDHPKYAIFYLDKDYERHVLAVFTYLKDVHDFMINHANVYTFKE